MLFWGRNKKLPDVDKLDVTYCFNVGSLPPEYHYTYTININSNSSCPGGVVSLYRFYDSTPSFWKEFGVSYDQIHLLYRLLLERDVIRKEWEEDTELSSKVGGSYEMIYGTLNGNKFSIPSFVKQSENIMDIKEFIEKLVPKDLLDEMTGFID